MLVPLTRYSPSIQVSVTASQIVPSWRTRNADRWHRSALHRSTGVGISLFRGILLAAPSPIIGLGFIVVIVL